MFNTKITTALQRAKTNFNNQNNLNPARIAQDFRGTFNDFSLQDFIIFKAGLDQAKTELIKGDKTKKDFEIFMYNLEDNFYNWSRFFGTESGAGNFLRRNGMFLINFVLLGVIFIYRLNNNIKITPSYLEVFIIVCVFNVILFIYHRCADYHSSCKIFGWSGSNAFAFILFIGLGAYLAILIKKNIDNKKKKEIK